MTPEQLQIFLKDNRESTAAVIKETVNGKIDSLSDLTEAYHGVMEEHIKKDAEFQVDMKADMRWIKWIGSGFVGAAGLLALKSLGL